MKKILALSSVMVFACLHCLAQYTTTGGIPITYWDFESNSARNNTLEITPELQINSGNTYDGKFGGSINTNGNGNFYDIGNAISYGNSSSGTSLTGYSWEAPGTSDPKAKAKTYFQFTLNTTGFTGLNVSFDADAYQFNSANYPSIGVLYSTDGSTYIWAGSISDPGNDVWNNNIAFALPSDASNNPNVKIRIYGWFGTNNKNSALDIDNLMVFATGTTANAGSKTSVDETAFYTGTTSGLTGFQWIRYSTFTVASGSTLVLGNGGIALGNTSTAGAVTVANGGTLDCGGTTDQIIAAGQTSALSTFTLNSGGSIIVRNSAGLSSSGASGDIQTTTRNFSSNANYTYGGNTAQATGVFTTSPTAQTVNNLNIVNSSGVSNSQALTISPTGILTLTSGIFTTTATNSITINDTLQTAISGGSATSFINGPLSRTFTKGLSLSSNVYTFPVGAGTTYLPFSATSLTTNSSVAPILQVQAYNSSSGGTGDNTTLATNGSLSTTEYWQTLLVNNSTSGITKGTVSLTRQTTVSPYNVIATCSTQSGHYAAKGGTPSGTSINNSINLADFASQFYVMAQTPTLSVSSALNPTSVTSCFGTASANMTLSVSGLVLINGVKVAPPSGFEVSSSSNGPFSTSFVTIGTGGTVPSTPVYIRLTASDAVGSYIGNVTISTTGGTSLTTAISSSTVKTTPTASITPASSSACEGTAVSVNLSGTSGASLSYNLNGGTTQNLTLPALPFNSPTNAGSYTYTLTSVTLAGCTGTFTNATSAITIQALPTVSSITGGAYVQTGTSLQLSNATTGGVWSSNRTGLGTVSSTGLVSGIAEGTPVISYSVTDNTSLHCQNQATQTVRVYNPDYITQTSGNFSSASTWEIDRDDNTFVTSVPIPQGTNYTSIRVQHALTLDQDFQLGSDKTFLLITGGTMDIAPNKTFSSLNTSAGAVDFAGKLVTIKSDASGTGAIGQMAATIANASNVQVERFIGSSSFATGRRAWRLLTAPLSDATINAAWQEGLVSNTNAPVIGNPNYGTLITGYAQGTAANAYSHGYDFWDAIANNTSSIRYYISGTTTGTWNSLTTLTDVKIADQPAYMLFVRGNRSVQSTGFGLTTLRAKGALKQGSFSTSISGANIYTLVGNPFASPLNFDQVYHASSNIKSQFLVWNSQNGNYGAYTLVIRNGDNDYSLVPNVFNGGSSSTSSNAQYIVSGEGFLVQPLSSAGGTVVINEQAKATSASVGINPYRLLPGTDKKLYVNLNLKNSDTSVTLADGFLARFDASYDTAVNEDDALKQSNFNENLSILHLTNNLIVEARPDVEKTDTLQMRLWNVVQRAYQFQVKAENFSSPGLHAFLEDSYLKTRQEVSLSSTITSVDFTVNSDTSSYSATRFRIVFQNDAAALPVTLTSVKAAPANNGVNISWTVTNEVNIKQYSVQRSTDGGRTYISFNNVAAKNTAGAAVSNYQSFDAQPVQGDNLYRIAIDANDGQVTYSTVVKVSLANTVHSMQIALYPNPVRKDSKVILQLSNLLAGSYLAKVFSENGQIIYQKKITVAANNATQSEELMLGGALAQGSYPIRITDSKGKAVYADKLIVGR